MTSLVILQPVAQSAVDRTYIPTAFPYNSQALDLGYKW